MSIFTWLFFSFSTIQLICTVIDINIKGGEGSAISFSFFQGMKNLTNYRITQMHCLWKLIYATQNKIQYEMVFWSTTPKIRLWWRFTYQWTELSSMLSKVASESWKMNDKVRGDRWRPAKNPPMAKLVSLWFFWCKGRVWITTFFADQCFYSTPTEQSSPFM